MLTPCGGDAKHAAPSKTDWMFLQMLNIELPYDAQIPHPEICPRELKTPIYTRVVHEYLQQLDS